MSKKKNDDALTKKARKKLEAREAELAAKLAEKKAAKKAKKKGDAPAAPAPMTKEQRDAAAPKAEAATPEERIATADRVLEEGGSEGAMDSARKAKVTAKRELRELGAAAYAELDRSDSDAVVAYNARFAEVTGMWATSDATKEEMRQRLTRDDVPAGDTKLAAAKHGSVESFTKDQIETPPADFDIMQDIAAVAGPALAAELDRQVAEVVETETGSIIAVGSEKTVVGSPEVVKADAAAGFTFAQPSEAAPELEEGRNGYKIMVLKEDGTPDPRTVRQFTRVTSYIGVLEDKTNLEKWKLRKLLEGVALNEETVAGAVGAQSPTPVTFAPDLFTSLVRDAVHNRDVAVAKARKADRKGKLEAGELGDRIAEAEKAFKDRLNAIAEEALELGGVHEAANKGTDIHALCDLYDTEGMAAVNDLLKAEKISPADHADVVAYATVMSEAGIKVLESEVVVVHDGLKRAGRLDRIVLAKLPGMQRAVRMVADIKTGSIDYGQAKLAQQLEAYASSRGYDLTTGERRDLKLSRKVGIVIHLPQGKAKASIYPVDLTIGAKGNKLAGEVRAFRNEGRKAVDFDTDLAKGTGE
jgi:hypothetical protein